MHADGQREVSRGPFGGGGTWAWSSQVAGVIRAQPPSLGNPNGRGGEGVRIEPTRAHPRPSRPAHTAIQSRPMALVVKIPSNPQGPLSTRAHTAGQRNTPLAPPPPTRNREARTASLWPFPWHHLCVATSVTALVASCGCGDLPGPHPRLVPVKWWCHDEVGGALVSLGSSSGIPLLAGHLGPSRLPRVWVSFIVGFSGKHTFGSNGAYRMGRWHPW